jgi:hypothetical protein
MVFGRYAFRCIFDSETVLPVYKGSTFRGVFGRALRSVVCALKRSTCSGCLLSSRCLYALVFEPALDPGETNSSRRRMESPPHPYVIEPPDDTKTIYSPGDAFEFTLLLFGKANESLPYFVYAIDQMGTMGIGRKVAGKAGTYTLESVHALGTKIYSGADRMLSKGDFAQTLSPSSLTDNPAPEPGLQRLGVRLVTPLRVKHQNHLEAELPFHVLVRTALRRASALFLEFDGAEPALDYRGLVRQAEQVREAEGSIHWYDWRRYSLRQDQAMLMGGMTGEIVYEGNLAEFMGLLRFCEQVHIGKQTTFGLGRIALFNPGDDVA